MTGTPISLSVCEAPDIQGVLAERIYEFNSKATGYFDGEYFSGTRRDESGAIQAGIYGYTWGGCCYVAYVWVDELEPPYLPQPRNTRRPQGLQGSAPGDA
jgi:hypothetical protein